VGSGEWGDGGMGKGSREIATLPNAQCPMPNAQCPMPTPKQ